MRYLILATALFLTSCGDDDDSDRPRPTPTPGGHIIKVWTVGPIINGKNYSKGLSTRPEGHSEGFAVGIGPTQEPHYVTFPHGSLTGKTKIRMSYYVDGPADVKIYGQGCSVDHPSAVTLYFQKKGDDWNTDGDRWWATFATKSLSGIGPEQSLEVSLNGPWSSVYKLNSATAPDKFASAKRNAESVGFTFGNCEGFGHGARATLPVKFIVTSFSVE